MSKQISSKKIMIIFGTAALVIAVAVGILVLNSKNSAETFRSIMVYDLQGNALIERADIGTINARENLYLESGDRILVGEDSMMRLKLDNDKYITATSNTVFTLEAEGNERDSKTRIYLEKGAIINEIQNPLSNESIYEAITPNAVMAVRGTVFRVELYDNGEGGLNTRLSCYSGRVAAIPVLPDGTSGEEVVVVAGSEITVNEYGTASNPQDIDYEKLSEQELKTLSAMNIGINADVAQSDIVFIAARVPVLNVKIEEATATATPSVTVIPTAAPAPSATATPTATPTAIPTATPTATPRAVVTSVEAVTPRAVVAPEPTAIPATTPAPSAAVTPSITPAPSAAVTPSITPAPSAAVTPSITPAPSAAVTPSITPAPSAAVTPSITPAPSAAVTPSITPVPSATAIPTITSTPSTTATPAPSAAATPATTPAPSATDTPAAVTPTPIG